MNTQARQVARVIPLVAGLLASGWVVAAPATPQSADLILSNGKIYTVSVEAPWAEAVAIRDGNYVYVGDAEGAEAYRGADTKAIDLDGRMAMPGINDTHSHPWQGGLKQLYECNFAFSAGPDEIEAALRGCIADNPDAVWITGGQWTSDFFKDNPLESPRAWLDDIADGRAVYLEDDSGHHAWVNSKALELAGIAADAPDPQGGKFLRDDDGVPNGIALESASILIGEVLPEPSHQQNINAIGRAVSLANAFGITGMLEARTPASISPAYAEADKLGLITAHVVTDLQTPYGPRTEKIDVPALLAFSERYASANVHTRFAKLYLDGVPTGSRSAVMLEPYLVDEKHPVATKGMLMIEPSVLEADLTALDAAGFTVKVHTAGDGSVRLALDAIEAVRKQNGASGLRHELGHAGYIDPADIPRFSQLNVTADLSPYLWYPRPIIDAVIGAVGERGYEYFPIKDLLDSGANVIMGSDWPSAAADMNPWPAIEAMVTRKNPASDSDETLWAEQAISLEQALHIATQQGALAYRLEARTGSVQVGKSADLIVLNQNLFSIPPSAISETSPDLTLFAGQVVYDRQAP
ncbi:MAG: amidohydrolase [Halieaceae bacterium]